MILQDPGFYVLQRDESFGKKICVTAYYRTIEDFFWRNSQEFIKASFRNTLNERIATSDNHWFAVGGYSRILVDENEVIYTTDRLIGDWRNWQWNRSPYSKRWFNRYNCGHKKSAHQGFRRIRTFQERKWYHAWDDEEFAPKPRACRSAHGLPNNWDDIYGHSDKSWKTQSKRKNQWKGK